MNAISGYFSLKIYAKKVTPPKFPKLTLSFFGSAPPYEEFNYVNLLFLTLIFLSGNHMSSYPVDHTSTNSEKFVQQSQ
jgi:hypothetical protein